MKIIQITDIHIGRPGEDTRGVDVRKNFQRILQAVEAENPDYLVISGDLCYNHPESDIYQWIFKTLKHSGANNGFHTRVTNGNHDSADLLAEYFGNGNSRHGKEIYFGEQWDERPVLFLDSGKGKMSEQQYAWIKQQLEGEADTALVFMHHPPVVADVPYMDRIHGFRQMQEIQDIFFNSDKEIHLFCGHYHVDKFIAVRNLFVYLTPSTYFQIRQDIEEFGVDHYRIAYRIIELEKEQLSTRLVWMDGNLLDGNVAW